jgi:hypothetical protein
MFSEVQQTRLANFLRQQRGLYYGDIITNMMVMLQNDDPNFDAKTFREIAAPWFDCEKQEDNS